MMTTLFLPRLHFFQSHPRSSKKRGMPRNLDLFGPPSAKQRQQEISIIDLAQQQQTSNEDHSLAVVTPVRKDKAQNHQHQSSKRLPNRALLFGPINDKKVHKNNAVIEILSD